MKNLKYATWGIFAIGTILIFSILCYQCIVDIHNLEENSEAIGVIKNAIKDLIEMLGGFLTPIGIMLGIAYGYPLLKQKLTEGYIIKHFDLIQDANNIVRTKCLQLLDKYNLRVGSDEISDVDLDNCIDDLKELKELCFNANKEVLIYAKILLDTFENLKKLRLVDEKKSDLRFDSLHFSINRHIEQIYDLAGRVYKIDSIDKAKKNQLIVDQLQPFLIDDDSFKVDGLDHSVKLHKASSTLLLFTSNVIEGRSNPLFFLSYYESVPDPAPLVRIMYNRKIYAPAKLLFKETIVENLVLSLIGFKAKTSRKLHNGEVTYYYELFYGNVSDIGFDINSIDDFTKMSDDYIFSKKINLEESSNFANPINNVWKVQIETKILAKNFKQNKKKIEKKMLEEKKGYKVGVFHKMMKILFRLSKLYA